ncbi:MAG: glycoside hydrolase family 36 N-terminal domain-containing protein, partial [Clostridia bacterium]
MSVKFDKSTMQFQLDTANTSYVMQVRDGYLLHIYWGAKLDGGDHSYMRWEQGRAAFSPRMENGGGFILDDTPLEYPCFGRGDLRNPAFEVINHDGTDIVDLQYKSYKIVSGKPQIKGLPATYSIPGDKIETLEIVLTDKISNLEVTLFYSVFENYDVITRNAVIKNDSDFDVKLKSVMSACIDFDTNKFDVISNYGTHCRER